MITATKSLRARVKSRLEEQELKGIFFPLCRAQLSWDSHLSPWVHRLLL